MRRFLFALFFFCISLTACTPKFDWRDVRNEENHFLVLMPGKAATAKRDIDLNGIKLTMNMTATEVQDINFLVAYVRIPTDQNDIENSKKQQVTALNAMKSGMLKNIQGKWDTDEKKMQVKDIESASGISINGRKLRMIGRFKQYDDYLVQVVMLGDEKAFSKEVAEMFFDSFKWNP